MSVDNIWRFSAWQVQGLGHLLLPHSQPCLVWAQAPQSECRALSTARKGAWRVFLQEGEEASRNSFKKHHHFFSSHLCLSRCGGFSLFSLVVTKSVFAFSNYNFLFSQSPPTLIQTFFLEGFFSVRGAKHLHRKAFLYSWTRKTSCSKLVRTKILNFQKISKWVYVTSHLFHPDHLSSKRPTKDQPLSEDICIE